MDAPLLEIADARDRQTNLPQTPSGNIFGSPRNSGADENGPPAFDQSSNVVGANPDSAILNTVSGTGNMISLVSSARAQPANPPNNGRIFVLPDGSLVPDQYSPTGYMMSPVADLSPVAAAGQRVGATYRQLMGNPRSSHMAFPYLVYQLYSNLAHGGSFDYQRSGGRFSKRFVGLSNFNVGLFGQQAGLSLDETLRIAGQYARLMSRNYTPNAPYGIDPKTRPLMEAGFLAGQQGMFNQAGP